MSVTLGPGPEIVPLPEFVQLGLTAIYKASSLEAFNAAFDSLFAKKMKSITFNGKKLSREDFMSQTRGEEPFARTASSVTFGGVVTDSSDNITGLAGVFYTATFNVQLVISPGPPPMRILQSSLNVSVKEDSSFTGVGDKRRIVSVDQIAIEHASK